MRSLIAIFCLLLLTHPALAADPAADFWTTDRLHTLHIRITPQAWQMMQPLRSKQGSLPRLSASEMRPPSTQPSTRPLLAISPSTQPAAPYREGDRLEPNFYGMQFAYAKADVECDGIALKNVGLRLRGNSSYNYGANGNKRPLKIDFNRFVPNQKLHGLAAIYLNSNAYDPSLLRETLAYEMFRELGVPAPRTTFALVYATIDGQLQREYLGLYTLIEEIDSKAFLKHHFDSSKGLLLKPWSIRGLPYFGEEWSAYQSRYNPESDITPDTARRTIDFIKLINYADDDTFRRQIDAYLDVDSFLRLLAGHVAIANLDNFLFTGHNFYMYLSPQDHRFHLMPWDLNLAFANFTSAATIDQAIHLSILRPHVGEMKLIDRLLAMPHYRDAYRQHIRRLADGYLNPQRLSPRIDALQAVLNRADAIADATWAARFTPSTTRPTTQPVKIPPRPRPHLTGWQGQPAIDLKTFATRRVASLQAQLAGETDGFTPGPRRLITPNQKLRAPSAFGSLPMQTLRLLNTIDPNWDGQLTASEIDAALRAFYADLDTKRQGFLTQPQLTQALTRTIQQLDPNRQDDRRRAAAQTAASSWAASLLAFADTSHTARLTLPDALAAAHRAFLAADKDKSAKLNADELLSLLDTLATTPPRPTTRPTTTPAP